MIKINLGRVNNIIKNNVNQKILLHDDTYRTKKKVRTSIPQNYV